MINASLNKTTYSVGDEIEIQLDFSSDEQFLDDIDNINIDIFRIERERNNFAFGFGYSPNQEEQILTIRQKLPASFKSGLYLVSGVRQIKKEPPDGIASPISIHDITRLFFWFSEENNVLSESGLTNKINQMDFERGKYNNAPTITELAKKQPNVESYRVLVFGVGCLIHSTQIMEGYTLHPLKQGYNYSHMLDAVNSYITPNCRVKLENTESIEKSFASSTPLFVVDFQNVKANNHADAGDHCTLKSEYIYTVLAYDRGQRPNSFATVIIDKKSGQLWQAFHFPGYKGNLVSDFNPSSTAQTLEKLLPKLNSSPWLDLIMRIYADAESEVNPCYACLKFWSILEMVSKKAITDNTTELSYPNGDKILDNGGNAVKTKSTLGKAYKHALESKLPPSVIGGGQNSTKYIFGSSAESVGRLRQYSENDSTGTEN